MITQTNAKAIFLQALELITVTDREAFLDTQCGSDADLRREVDELLLHHRDVGSFLESPPTAVIESAEQLRTIAHETPSLEFLQPSTRADSLGRLAHYEILEVVGSGGMGIVLKAFDEQLHRIVAIKAMNATLAASATGRQRFVREAQAAAAVNHDNVVDIYAVDETGPVPYLVMEYIAGISLEDKLAQQGPLELKEILRIGLQTADGLAAAHRQGLVHRDVKPANILLENGVGRVKITDFGLARAIDDVSVTQSGIIAGTPAYMSPEQARGETVDHRSDLFSLGSVLYVLCCGRAPFRSSTSLGMLSHVCEEQPHPIRDLNPDIPEWLCAIVQRLHAKLPAERFQSATELAETLGGCLAHVQQPSLPLPTAMDRAAAPQQSLAPVATRKSRHVRRYVVAAVAALILLGLTLSLTDASGITHVAATVIRIFTPSGTLVVETDDPAVKVTVEGDGGLVITGAGLEEIRLRPGNYRVQADRNGKPVALDKDLVTVSRGGRAIVKVKLEPPPAVAAAKVKKGAFVLLGGGIERKFDTLAEAVQGASGGDIIEVRGNGPFVTPPMKINSALTIRAGDGFRPVFDLTVVPLTQAQPENQVSFQTAHPLVLEGLEFRLSAPDGTRVYHFVVNTSTDLRVANCRFQLINALGFYFHYVLSSSVWEVRNCEFICAKQGGSPISKTFGPGHKLIVENCVATRTFAISGGAQNPQEPCLELTRNTFRSINGCVEFIDQADQERDSDNAQPRGDVLLVEASGNIVDSGRVVVFTQRPASGAVPAANDGSNLAHAVDWKGTSNLYSVNEQFVTLWTDQKGPYEPAKPVRSLADWNKFWATAEADSLEGRVRYQGGDLLTKVEAAPELLTPEDFRLRADSAGYKAGKDGKDLGADVDLVGPGAAYERWKKTPEYQQWLKETKQVAKAEAPKAESKAFVVLGAKGAFERKFDTLVEAVQGASDGDTIEVCGNGPFVSGPINITQALTIRAGEGFRPVIQLSSSISTNSSLVLEGLELQRLGEKIPIGREEALVFSYHGKSLYLANCRFREHLALPCVVTDAQSYFVRNCEFLCPHQPAINRGGWLPGKPCVIDNCVAMGVGYGILETQGIDPDQHDTSVRLTHNTVMSGNALVYYLEFEKHRELTKADHVIPVEAAGNIFDVASVLVLVSRGTTLQPKEVERLLRLTQAWRGGQNVYGPSAFDVRFPVVLPNGPKNLKDWKQFWGTDEAGSIEGQVKYQGGDLRSRLRDAPEKVTPDDFRLRSDSAGYRAGEDGKDLGADVDLVGPGPAYERWKQTPEYQQWLKDTGQQN